METVFYILKYWEGNIKHPLAGEASLYLESELKSDFLTGQKYRCMKSLVYLISYPSPRNSSSGILILLARCGEDYISLYEHTYGRILEMAEVLFIV